MVLAKAMGLDRNLQLESVFDEHDRIFGARKSKKNEEQWAYMRKLGFHQEYFEQDQMLILLFDRVFGDIKAARNSIAEFLRIDQVLPGQYM